MDAPTGTPTASHRRHADVSPPCVLPVIVPSRIGCLLSPGGFTRIRFFNGKTLGKTAHRCHDGCQNPNITIYEYAPNGRRRVPGACGGGLSPGKGSGISVPCHGLSKEIVEGIEGAPRICQQPLAVRT